MPETYLKPLGVSSQSQKFFPEALEVKGTKVPFSVCEILETSKGRAIVSQPRHSPSPLFIL